MQQTRAFPFEFYVEFTQFNKDFSIKFSQMAPQDNMYPIQSSDIFVIDELTGNPVKFELHNVEVGLF